MKFRFPMQRLYRVFTLAAALGLTVAPAALAAPKEYTVVMANMSFGKLPAGVKVGDVIVWVNRDTVVHSATARDHSFDVRTNPGQSVRMTVKKAGSTPFYCIFHAMMRGTLVVSS